MKKQKKICPNCGRRTLIQTINCYRCISCGYINIQGKL